MVGTLVGIGMYWILLWEELGYGMTSCEIFGKFRFRVWKPGDFLPQAQLGCTGQTDVPCPNSEPLASLIQLK